MLMLTATAGRLYMCTLVSVVPCGRDIAVAEAAEQIRAEQCRSASRPNKNIFKPTSGRVSAMKYVESYPT